MMKLLTSTRWGSRLFFRTISQTGIHYRRSTISAGKAGSIKGGDRLPWIPDDIGDNFTPLQSLDWQFHVYGAVTPSFRNGLASTGITLKVFKWRQDAEKAGLIRDAAYLVRPDGHVALVSTEQDMLSFELFLARNGITARTSHPEPSDNFLPFAA
jgi:hypothetical protein